jgi:hypothetical protein
MDSCKTAAAMAGQADRLSYGQDRDFDHLVYRLRYLPPKRLADWDLRYEHGLDQLIYLQNLIEED